MFIHLNLFYRHNEKGFNFAPSYQFDTNNLEDGTPSGIVKVLVHHQKCVDQLSSQIV